MYFPRCQSDYKKSAFIALSNDALIAKNSQFLSSSSKKYYNVAHKIVKRFAKIATEPKD
jgi:hypothetical protein